MGIRSYIRATILLVLFAMLAVPHAAAPAQAQRTIHIAIDKAYAPFSFQSDDGTLQGIAVDQWRAWELRTGIKAELHPMDWSEALRRMRAGEFDVIEDIVETPQRSTEFEFTPAYATIEAAIFFRSEISGVSDFASL